MYRLTIGRPGHQLTSLLFSTEYKRAAEQIRDYLNSLRRGHQPKAYVLRERIA